MALCHTFSIACGLPFIPYGTHPNARAFIFFSRSICACSAFCPLCRRKTRNTFRVSRRRSYCRPKDRAFRQALRGKSPKGKIPRQTPAQASLNPSL